MAKITQLYKTPGNSGHEMKEYRTKLFRHRAGRWARILTVLAVLLAIGACMRLWFRNKTYAAYEIKTSTERTDALNTQYAEYNGNILKCSRDGISCVTLKNEAVWSQTYNMQNPILAICQNAVAVADRQGNEIYVFDGQGLQTQITTLLPIQQLSISAQGVTAVLLNDSDTAWISLYDKEGTKLTESRCSLEQTGQPLSIALSSGGTKLAVSYLQVQSGVAESCVVFYNFGAVGGNFVDKIVSSKVYEGTIIPRLQYLDDSICAAVSDRGVIFYEGKEIPEEKASAEENGEIRSIFFGSQRVGLVVDGTGEEASKYEVHLYAADGSCVLSQGTDLAYSSVKLSGGSLILYSEHECEIYSEQGILKYSGTFDGMLADIYKGSGFRKYILVFSDRTEEIKLK